MFSTTPLQSVGCCPAATIFEQGSLDLPLLDWKRWAMTRIVVRALLRLFGVCSHERETWPIRLADQTNAHRTCLDCGRTRPYALLDTWAISAKAAKTLLPEVPEAVPVGADRRLVTLPQVILAFGRSPLPTRTISAELLALAGQGRSLAR